MVLHFRESIHALLCSIKYICDATYWSKGCTFYLYNFISKIPCLCSCHLHISILLKLIKMNISYRVQYL